jgi:hypothetical protein
MILDSKQITLTEYIEEGIEEIVRQWKIYVEPIKSRIK